MAPVLLSSAHREVTIDMPLRTRSLLPCLLALACSAERRCEEALPGAPVAAPEAPPPVALAEVEVDARPPMRLAAWRAAQQRGEAAAREPALAQRIDRCRAFVREHPTHPQSAAVLEALVEALIQRGGFDPVELAGHVEALAAAQRTSGGSALLVERYHLARGLPTASGVALLVRARERLAREEQELAQTEVGPFTHVSARVLAMERARTFLAEARLHLRDGALAEASRALDAAESAAGVRDVALVDRAGAVRRTLPTGVLEEFDVLRAELRRRQGDLEGARAALARAVGATRNVEIRATFDRLRAALALDGGDRVVRAEVQSAPDFALPGLRGDEVTLRDHRGKIVLLTFFATWCGPCKAEMPLLQKFRDKNRDRGVEVLAISIDRADSRDKIEPLFAELGLDLPVLLADDGQLAGYDHAGIPALYVIDREGRIAHARTGYVADLEARLEHDLQALVDRESQGGRPLLTIERAPAGWGVLWQRPVPGDLSAVAVAPPLGDAPGEVGVAGREGLRRWSAAGEALGATKFSGVLRSLDAADLDGDGAREWIASSWSDLKVLDAAGELYWDYAGEGAPTVLGHRDLDGDGAQELALLEADRVIAMKSVPQPMWTTPPVSRRKRVTFDPAGAVWVQSADELVRIDARGRSARAELQAPAGREYCGRVSAAEGALDLFGGPWDEAPRLGHDFDGDGRADLMFAGHGGVVVYDAQGEVLLRLRGHDIGVVAAAGDLDGRPGAELALLVEHYGLIVLGGQGA